MTHTVKLEATPVAGFTDEPLTAAMPPDRATRARWAAEHRTRLMAMLETPASKHLSQRTWRAEWWTDDRMHAAMLGQLLILPAGADPRTTPRVSVQITTDAAATPNAVRFLGLVRDYDLADIVAFCRLDAVDPATVTWRDTTRNHGGIITVESALASAIAKQATQ